MFEAVSERGVPCGRVSVYEQGSSGGYATFLTRSGADEGDVLFAHFDLVEGTVRLSLGDDLEPDLMTPET